jgi:uncharacterized protein YndB with AHSA1/START domain
MTERNAVHAVFTVERTYAAAPARVFAAWADKEAKSRWFGADKTAERSREMDFRVGGRERLSGTWHGDGGLVRFEAHCFDILPNERIVYAYDMYLGDQHISVSLATAEFKPSGTGTRLVVTEQGTFLDGYDDAGSREQGTGSLLEQVGNSFEMA